MKHITQASGLEAQGPGTSVKDLLSHACSVVLARRAKSTKKTDISGTSVQKHLTAS